MHDKLARIESIKITDLAWTLQQTALNSVCHSRQAPIYFNGKAINGTVTWDYEHDCWNLD